MKTKKGFTLVEILVTIAIIGIILLIAIPSMMTISNSIKKRALEAKKESIISAAELYAKNNKDAFGDANQIEILVETLLLSGNISKDSQCETSSIGCIINPVDNTSMNNESILIKRVNSIVQAEFGTIPLVERVIYFDGNGANQSELGAVALSCQSRANGSCEVSAPTISRSNYNAAGWNTDSNSTTALLNVGDGITLSAETTGSTYYAITSKTLTATFNKNDADSISSTSESCLIYNTETICSITTPTITASSGYTAVGWNTSSSATTASVNESSTLSLTNNITYYAILGSKKYTCSIAATYYCSNTNFILDGSSCKHTYETSTRDQSYVVYSNYCDYQPSGRVTCSGAGGTWNRNCSLNGQCEISGEEGGILPQYKCVSSCKTEWICESGYTGGGTSSKVCTKTESASLNCSIGVLSGSSCYLYGQSSCPSGWVSTEE